MTNDPGDETPEQSGDDDRNPFKGTPFEQFFTGGGLGNLGAIFGAPGACRRGGDARPRRPVRSDPGDDAALRRPAQLGRRHRHGPPRASRRRRTPPRRRSSTTQVADAVRLADLWLDETTEFPSGVQSTAAWSRAEWIVGTVDRWKRLVEPIAESSVAGIGNALPRRRGAGDGRPDRRHARQGHRRDARLPGRLRPRRAGRRGAQRLRRRPAARGARQGRAGGRERQGVRRRPRRHRGGRAALPRAARGRPPAPVRPRAVAARAPARRGRRLRQGHRGQHREPPELASRRRCAAST